MNNLLNVAGLSIGLALYAMLLAMVLGSGARARVDRLALATALLGLVWDLCALAAYELPPTPARAAAVCGFSALGFLPAVVVHSVLRGSARRHGSIGAALTSAAYIVSGLAASLHVAAAVTSRPLPSATALRLLTACFIGMLLPLALLTRGQAGARRTLWGVALAAFAVSALHLSQFEKTGAAWPIELIGHNASIPLAVAILYQDYPFAFADLFLKRAITLVAVVTAVAGAFWITGIGFGPAAVVTSRQIGALMSLAVVVALTSRRIAAAAGWFVDSVLLTRPDYRAIEQRLARRLQQVHEPAAVLDDICGELAVALSAASVRWFEDDRESAVEVAEIVSVDAGRSAAVRIPVTERPRYRLEIDVLTRGRRLLSGDVTMLSAVAVIAARRIDAHRLGQERYERQLREREIAQLVTEAELRALRAQLNPHFLFNALTTVGYLIQAAPDRAVETLVRLTTLLRAGLRPEGEFTTLGRELELIDAYLAIERARFEDRLRVAVDVPAECRDIRVPSLLIQPLVENAIKHGIAPVRAGGDVVIAARVGDTPSGRSLTVSVRNSTPARDRHGRRHWTRGVGLTSVERRLACHYGAAASLQIRSDTPGVTVVNVTIPAPAVVGRSLARSAG
jgi:two-component system, LytTR family, sensor kinase